MVRKHIPIDQVQEVISQVSDVITKVGSTSEDGKILVEAQQMLEDLVAQVESLSKTYKNDKAGNSTGRYSGAGKRTRS